MRRAPHPPGRAASPRADYPAAARHRGQGGHSGQGGLNNTVIQYSIRIVVPITQWSSNGKFLGSVPENYTQTKILSSNISSTQDVADIQFNNLIIGKNYEIGGTVRSEATAGTAELNAYSASGGGGTLYGVVHQNSNSNTPTIEVGYGANVKFKAVSSTLYLRFTTATSESLKGDGTKNGTFITLSELNFTKETTRFL